MSQNQHKTGIMKLYKNKKRLAKILYSSAVLYRQ